MIQININVSEDEDEVARIDHAFQLSKNISVQEVALAIYQLRKFEKELLEIEFEPEYEIKG